MSRGRRRWLRIVSAVVALTCSAAGCSGPFVPSAGPDAEAKQEIGATLSALASLACARYVETVEADDLRAALVDPTAASIRAFFAAVEPRYADCRAAADWDEVEVDGSEATASAGGITYTLVRNGAESTERDELEVTLSIIDGAWWVVGLASP